MYLGGASKGLLQVVYNNVIPKLKIGSSEIELRYKLLESEDLTDLLTKTSQTGFSSFLQA